jgi:hypothetical protein
LPSRQAILAACHLEIAVDPGRGKGLDLVIHLGLNELLDAFHMPAPLLPGYGSFMGAFQVVVKKARSGVMDDGGGV